AISTCCSGSGRRSTASAQRGIISTSKKLALHVFAVAGAAVGEVQGEQALGESAVGGRLVARWVVEADAGWDAVHNRVVVRPEEKRDCVARGVVAVDDAVRRRTEAVVRVACQHCPGEIGRA